MAPVNPVLQGKQTQVFTSLHPTDLVTQKILSSNWTALKIILRVNQMVNFNLKSPAVLHTATKKDNSEHWLMISLNVADH